MTTARHILGVMLVAILVSLAVTHVYWASGGRIGRAAAVPSRDGRPLFRPSPTGTLMVGVALLGAASVICGALGWLPGVAPPGVFRWLTLAIALLFLLRAVGDFEHVGFFKSSSGAPFDYWDLRLFSPLCLLIAALAFVVGWRAD